MMAERRRAGTLDAHLGAWRTLCRVGVYGARGVCEMRWTNGERRRCNLVYRSHRAEDYDCERADGVWVLPKDPEAE